LEHELHEESESGDDTVDEYGHCPTGKYIVNECGHVG
jgi:hypothetical protein